ncbi:hypothetical protein EYF80_036903 [Liparis tanakae]|uniref:Uncharacterized protein n=1 Tax=Liparis tanakae TaxID=230148 RepID=A0A4Z2GHU3_9TELE|nr:hypothetical protein EYF80_036903 [Liparis tanakae]
MGAQRYKESPKNGRWRVFNKYYFDTKFRSHSDIKGEGGHDEDVFGPFPPFGGLADPFLSSSSSLFEKPVLCTTAPLGLTSRPSVVSTYEVAVTAGDEDAFGEDPGPWRPRPGLMWFWFSRGFDSPNECQEEPPRPHSPPVLIFGAQLVRSLTPHPGQTPLLPLPPAATGGRKRSSDAERGPRVGSGSESPGTEGKNSDSRHYQRNPEH